MQSKATPPAQAHKTHLLQLLPCLSQSVDSLALDVKGTIKREVPHALERAHHVTESVIPDDASPCQLERHKLRPNLRDREPRQKKKKNRHKRDKQVKEQKETEGDM